MTSDLTTTKGQAPAAGRTGAGPGWLVELVAHWLGHLRRLGLAGTEKAVPDRMVNLGGGRQVHMMDFVIDGWVRQIMIHYAREELEPADAPRLSAGFEALADNVTWWPVPAQLWDYVPERQAPPPHHGTCACGRAIETAAAASQYGECLQCALKHAPQRRRAEREARSAEKSRARPRAAPDPENFKARLAKLRRELLGKSAGAAAPDGEG